MFAQLAHIRTADLAFTRSLISMIDALQMAQFSPLRTSKMQVFFQDISVMIYLCQQGNWSVDGLWPFSTRLNSRDSLCAVFAALA